MYARWWYYIFISTTLCIAKEPELPLCPTNIQFFPQNLPMHCRMPANGAFQNLPQNPVDPQMQTLPPMLPPFYQSPPPDKMPQPVPIPVPPGVSGPMTFPGAIPMPMMPLPAPGSAHKLPVIVMPFYSPDPSYKKPHAHSKPKRKRKKIGFHKKRRIESDETSSDTDTSDETSVVSTDRGWWKKRIGRDGRKSSKYLKRDRRKHNKNKEMLTPLLQYVTKDGYVIYEKKISKGEAKDWLNTKHEDGNEENKNIAMQEITRSGEDDDVVLEEVKPNPRNNVENHKAATEGVRSKQKQRQHKVNPRKNNLLQKPP